MTLWTFLNNKRLRDYPRLIFIASWSVLLLNAFLHQGWIGGISGIMIGGDFISNYSGGNLYLTDASRLYDITAQEANQTGLVAPSQSPGFAPFISPPYVALAASWLQAIPMSYAFIGWEILNFISILASAYLLFKYIFPFSMQKALSPFQTSILILSSLATVIGFLAGQSHGIILLLITGIVVAMIREKWYIAGILGSILLYKPQFVLGFLICWLVWGCFKALLSFGVLAVLWQIPVIINHGLSPYLGYLNFSKTLLYLPYAKSSFPISIMATPYAFFATLFPPNFSRLIQIFIIVLAVISVGLVAFVAFRVRTSPIDRRQFSMSLAILLPLVIAPHTLIYDLLILVPAFVLLASIEGLTEKTRTLVVLFYICLLLLPLIGYVTKLALPGLIPMLLFCYLITIYFRTNKTAVSS